MEKDCFQNDCDRKLDEGIARLKEEAATFVCKRDVSGVTAEILRMRSNHARLSPAGAFFWPAVAMLFFLLNVTQVLFLVRTSSVETVGRQETVQEEILFLSDTGVTVESKPSQGKRALAQEWPLNINKAVNGVDEAERSINALFEIYELFDSLSPAFIHDMGDKYGEA